MMLTAFLNPNPDAIIKQQAELVSKSWGKSIPKADRVMLELIIAAKQDRGAILRRAYEHYSAPSALPLAVSVKRICTKESPFQTLKIQ